MPRKTQAVINQKSNKLRHNNNFTLRGQYGYENDSTKRDGKLFDSLTPPHDVKYLLAKALLEYGKHHFPIDKAKEIETVTTQIKERVATISALQKQYGPQVRMHPLLPQEASALTRVLDESGPQQQSTIFGTLRVALNDDESYMAAMSQIAPDSPVKALAGALYAKQRGITLEKRWFGTDRVAASTDVANTLLIGESIVNKTKAQKAEDGKPRSLYLPPRTAFEGAFASAAGNLYRGREKAQETDLQAAYAYYVGRAAQTGRLTSSSTDIDSNLVKESLAATVGEPINFHGQGMVTAPWGMTENQFTKNIGDSLAKVIRENDLPQSLMLNFDNYGLIHYRSGTYVPTLGGLPVLNPKTGRVIVLSAEDSPINPGLKVPK